MLKHHPLNSSFTDLVADETTDTLAAAAGSPFAVNNEFGAITVLAAAAPVAALTNALYLTEAGNTNAISYTDINQDGIGDCFLVSPIGEIAMLKPTFISNMIHANADGTETVALYEGSTGRLPNFGTTAFKPVTETVTNVFASDSVNSGATQDVVGKSKEIWAQVIEKAVAQLNGGYSQIQYGGYPTVAMEELTGKVATTCAPQSATFGFLTAAVAAGDMITFDTQGGNLTNGLYGNHCYMFQSTTGSGSAAMVHLVNPWGIDQPTAISLSNMTRDFGEIDLGHT